MNAQIQLNGNDDRWYLRGFIQNVANSSSTTGLYVSDQSQGVFTNIFTLEPRRYGIAAGFKFSDLNPVLKLGPGMEMPGPFCSQAAATKSFKGRVVSARSAAFACVP